MTAISPDFARYSPPLRKNWQGRIDGPDARRIHEAIQFADLQNAASAASYPSGSYGFIGFASDTGVTRNQGTPGAKLGPETLRKALAKLPLPGEECHLFDFGDIICTDDDLEASQFQLGIAVNHLLGKGVFPLVLGGGHELAWGHYQGVVSAHPQTELDIVNFDAHFDLRPLLPGGKGSSGTSFTQIARHSQQHNLPFKYTCLGIQRTGNTDSLFKRAKDLNVHYVFAESFHLGGISPLVETLDDTLTHSDHILLTICMDVFASAFAPGVSAPQPLGLYPWHVLPLIQHLARSHKVVSLNIAELCPPRDRDEMTAGLAASLIFHFIAAHKRVAPSQS